MFVCFSSKGGFKMPIKVPTESFLTKGVGRHKEKLTSFEFALRDAGIAPFNIVSVSSILPPNAKMIPKDEGLEKLLNYRGGIVHCVMSKIETNEPNRLIVAANGIAVPRDHNLYGYISEHHAYGQTDSEGGDYAEDLAVRMLATTHFGVEIDIDASYNPQSEEYKVKDQIVRTSAVAQSAIGKRGVWTTVVTAVVFCDYK